MSNPTGKGGKKFFKGDPRIKLGGRPKKTVSWKEAEDALREAIPRILRMEKNELQKLLASNPTGVEMLAAKYIHEHCTEAVNRFLGKTPEVVHSELTGKDGVPLQSGVPVIDFGKFEPDEIRKLIKGIK